MPDPFEALLAPHTPVSPDPAFAARLRDRIKDALLRTRGDHAMPNETLVTPSTEAQQGDAGYVSLWVPDVERAAAFFGAVLGWRFAPPASGQGRQIEGLTLPHGLWGDQRRSTLFVCYYVDDVDAAVDRVRASGGRAEPPTDEGYGRVANCVDDQDLAFAVFRPRAGERTPRPPLNGAVHGDIEYLTYGVRDAARARAFYVAVLGWRFSPGRAQDGWNIDNVSPMSGLHGGQAEATVVPMYRVDDIQSAVHRVRQAGGTASDPTREPYGQMASCVDDQGTRFYLGQV